jgi:uncharacterized protein with GYD domain
VASVVVPINFTDEGIHNVNKQPKKVKAATTEAEKLGIKIKDIY